MKRHKALHPLTEEHHHGLVLCQRLRQTAPINPDEAEAMLKSAWARELEDHFRLEDDVLLPEMARVTSETHPEIIRVCTDHVALRLLLRQIARASGSEKGAFLVAFADRLEEHIRYEERVVFCEAENVLGEEGLSQLGFVSRYKGEKGK